MSHSEGRGQTRGGQSNVQRNGCSRTAAERHTQSTHTSRTATVTRWWKSSTATGQLTALGVVGTPETVPEPR